MKKRSGKERLTACVLSALVFGMGLGTVQAKEINYYEGNETYIIPGDDDPTSGNIINVGGTANLYHVWGSNAYKKDAILNTVNIEGGTVIEDVTGAHVEIGNARENTVSIKNTTKVTGFEDSLVMGWVYGARVYGGSANDNKVYIADSVEVGNHVFGAVVYYGDAIGNSVSISGGEIGGNVYGGAVVQGEQTGVATGNTVNISGGTIKGAIYGGAIVKNEYWVGDYEAPNCVEKNTLNVSNSVSLSNALYNFDYVNLKGATLSGNVLTLVNHITAASEENTMTGLSGTIEDLTLGEGAALTINECNDLTIKNPSLTLNNNTLSGVLPSSITSVTADKGTSTLKDFSVAGALSISEGAALSVDNVSAKSFTAGAGSRLIVDGAKALNTYAISGLTDGVSIASTAQLFVDNAKKGETYHILDGKAVTADTGYEESNLLLNAAASNSFLKLVLKNSKNEGHYDVMAVQQKTRDVFDDVIIPDAVDEALTNDEDSPAADFFNTAADSKTHATRYEQASAINSLAELGSLAGLTHGTYRAASMMTDAFTDHLSRDVHPEQGRDLWAVYTHSKDSMGGMNLAGHIEANYDLQQNGVVVGSDLWQSGTATAGIAISYADGSTSGWNGVARTKNDADYYGISLYGRKDCGSMTYLGDITYLHGSNDLTQQNSGKRITADADTDALSVGLTAQREYQAGPGRLTPYAGLRYMRLGTDSYNDSLGLKHDAADQDLFVLPVGIKYAADVQDPCGWTWRPTVEAGYVWNLGDRDTSEHVSYHGVGNTFGYNTLDSGHLVLKLGIQAEKENLTYGLAYEHQNGDTTEANIFTADIKVRF